MPGRSRPGRCRRRTATASRNGPVPVRPRATTRTATLEFPPPVAHVYDPHRYAFTIYSLDDTLALGADASPDDVRGAIDGHALARGTLTGRFGR